MKNNDKPSLSRYSYGVTTLKHKDKYVTTSVGSSYDSFLRRLPLNASKKGQVPSFVEHRPDLISNIFYDTPGYWWYVMAYNGLTDPFEQLKPGSDILIPEL
jgi:hypothetical protein|tara:strand:+ start:862 stop:1164 length:303 start_codon:yes stop_codon:yes gene_type:complete